MQIYLLTKEEGGREKPLTDKFHIHMFSKTWDCSIVGAFKGGKEMMMPGENGIVRFPSTLVPRLFLYSLFFCSVFTCPFCYSPLSHLCQSPLPHEQTIVLVD